MRGFFISLIGISGAKTCRRGVPGWAQPTRACPPLLVHLGGLYPHGGPIDDPPNTIKSHYSRKIREKELSRSTRRSRRQALSFLGRAELVSVWGSGEGIIVLCHHQPFSIANSMMPPLGVSNSFVGSLVGEELDEIHHVIELVLLGLIASIHYVLRLMLL